MIVLVHLTGTPGLFQHLEALAHGLATLDSDFRVCANKENLSRFAPSIVKDLYIDPLTAVDRLAEEAETPAFYIYSPARRNVDFIRSARRRIPDARILYHLHEPDLSDSSHSWWRKFAINAIQERTCSASNMLVVSSDYALALARLRFPNVRAESLPLPFLDRPHLDQDKLWDVCAVGNLGRDRGFDRFVECARRLPDLHFAVLTARPERALPELTKDWPRNLRLTLGKSIGNDEIVQFIARSRIVLMPYIRSTQSGVIPIAHMTGTPAVTTAVGGLREDIDPPHGGLVVEDTDDIVGKLAAATVRLVDETRSDAAAVAARCRRLFLSRHGHLDVAARLVGLATE